jgi:protein phosphatase 1 regulatory subunit 11
LYYRDEGVIDNEGLGRKSSKRCCIFHKARAFGESSTDSSDYDSADDKNNKKKIARKKQGGIGNDKKKTPDHLRFHA